MNFRGKQFISDKTSHLAGLKLKFYDKVELVWTAQFFDSSNLERKRRRFLNHIIHSNRYTLLNENLRQINDDHMHRRKQAPKLTEDYPHINRRGNTAIPKHNQTPSHSLFTITILTVLKSRGSPHLTLQ